MQLRIKPLLGIIFLVGVQFVALRFLFTPTISPPTSDDPHADSDVLPEFLAFKAIEHEAYNNDIEELQKMLDAAHAKLVRETEESTKWQLEQEVKLKQEREENEKERVEFHRMLEEATEKKHKQERERKEKLLLLNKIREYSFTDDEWDMQLQMNIKPSEWSARHVLEWARRTLKLDSEDLLSLSKMQLSGSDLVKMSKKDFITSNPSAPLPLGTATLITEEVALLMSESSGVGDKNKGGNKEEKGEKRKRVIAIVGAGFGGIATAREVVEGGHTPIIIEESHKPGGIWIYDPSPEATSGYASLSAQGSASDVNFRNYLIPSTFTGRLTIQQMGMHIKGFWDKFGLEKYAVFNTHVVKIESLLPQPVAIPPNWLLPVTDKKTLSSTLDKKGN